jgi:predicted MFS family arabinose efflux permease
MLKIGFSEFLLLFAAVALWHSQTFAIITFCMACFCALCRWSLEQAQKTKEAEAHREAAKILNEQVQEVGDVLGTVFGKKKKKDTMH